MVAISKDVLVYGNYIRQNKCASREPAKPGEEPQFAAFTELDNFAPRCVTQRSAVLHLLEFWSETGKRTQQPTLILLQKNDQAQQ